MEHKGTFPCANEVDGYHQVKKNRNGSKHDCRQSLKKDFVLQNPDIWRFFHLKEKILMFTSMLVWTGCGPEIVKSFTMTYSHYSNLPQGFHIFWIQSNFFRISTYEVQWTQSKMGKRTTTFQSTLSYYPPPPHTWKRLANELLEDIASRMLASSISLR